MLFKNIRKRQKTWRIWTWDALFRKKKSSIYEAINGKDIKGEARYGIGRKRKSDETQRNHDKYKSDNIIKK